MNACGGGGGPAIANQTANPSKQVDATGGTLTDPTTGAQISIEPGSLLLNQVTVSITSTEKPSAPIATEIGGQAVALSRVFSLSKDSAFNFTTPVEVTLPYSRADLQSSDAVTVAYFDTGLSKWIPYSSLDVVDARSEGRVTFKTNHFSLWTVIRNIFPRRELASYDTGFSPLNDGFSFANFGVAVTADGKSFPNGICGGMASVASWYYKYKKATDGAASVRFPDDAAYNSRSFLAHMQSNFALREVAGFQADWLLKNSVSQKSAAIDILNTLRDNAMPIVLYGANKDTKKAHFVTVYAYDHALREFSYYDPNYPGEARFFSAAADGSITSLSLLGSPTTHFRALIPSRGDVGSHEQFVERYADYKRADQNNPYSGDTWGKITNVQYANTGSGLTTTVRVTGKISKSTALGNQPLFIRFFANKALFASPGVSNEPEEVQFGIGTLNKPTVVVQADGSFTADISRAKFIAGNIPIQAYFSTVENDMSPFLQGPWAFARFILPALASLNEPPIAAFTANPTSAAVNTAITFNASASSDPDGSISTYAWTFGDGSSGSGVNASRAYANVGSYTVTLTVTDNGGAQASTSRRITVTATTTTVPSTPSVVSFFDDFSTSLNGSNWAVTAGTAISGGSGGYLGLQCFGNISTRNKVSFTGNKIIIESAFYGSGVNSNGLHDAAVVLVDTVSGSRIQFGDTNYHTGGGFYFLASGLFDNLQTSISGTTRARKEYRLTLQQNSAKLERGETLLLITESRTFSLPSSVSGRTFHLDLGTGGPDYCNAYFDWIRVFTE